MMEDLSLSHLPVCLFANQMIGNQLFVLQYFWELILFYGFPKSNMLLHVSTHELNMPLVGATTKVLWNKSFLCEMRVLVLPFCGVII